MKIKKFINRLRDFILHYISQKKQTYYYEDYIRVYPDGINFNKYGKRKKATPDDIKNFINHYKFYKFAAQFVKNKVVADIGCGAGYGCQILKEEGFAARAYGADMSKPSIEFAQARYGNIAEFSIQGITNLKEYLNHSFDVVICSEVLEHIKEYHKEDSAIKELKRVTKEGGIIIIGTPNTEMLDNHGFSYEEIQTLLANNFNKFCVFENALVPYSNKKELWNKRLLANKVGIIVTQDINFNEMVIPKGINPELKKGLPSGFINVLGLEINTALLHNTHSWAIVAVN
ncbi:MAG: class I SAM-dependent methyltransferase [Candidatus Omnitrophota bacterium]